MMMIEWFEERRKEEEGEREGIKTCKVLINLSLSLSLLFLVLQYWIDRVEMRNKKREGGRGGGGGLTYWP